jgi:DNA-binding transcriptional regulator PaaX
MHDRGRTMFGKRIVRDKRKKLLYEFLKSGGAMVLVFAAPGAAPYLLKGFMKKNNMNNSQLNRSLKIMKEEGLISMKEDKDGSITVKLKKEGKIRAQKYQIEEMELKKPRKWDKKWRMVIFDIPESKKVARNVLKAKLDELGFRLIQKSVYIHPFPCEEEIEFIAAVYEVKKYVQVHRIDRIHNEKSLLKLFGMVE